MAYTITDKCISCQRCLTHCPTNAIETDGATFWIDADRCNNCLGSYTVPQCWAACPTNGGCVPSLAGSTAFALSTAIERSADYWKAWFSTYHNRLSRLKESKHSDYWKTWFDTYAQNLQKLQGQSQESANLPLTP
ncbi:MAG: 4Fe-4S binding protein [Cyanobacteria bacterium J06606_4]